MFKQFKLWLAIITCVIAIQPTHVNADGSWIITRTHTEAVVTSEGEIKVKEKVSANFGESRKTGISHTIPLKYSHNGSVWFVKISDVRVQRNQVDEVYASSGNDDQLIITVGDERLDITGEQSYTFEYVVKGALQDKTKFDQLYLSTTGGWETTVEQASSVIKLAKNGISEQWCEIRPKSGAEEDSCQSVGLDRAESRFVTRQSLRPGAYMYAAIEYENGLIPIATVNPPSITDWMEVYRQPLIILTAISLTSLGMAAILWFKARKLRLLEQRQQVN